MRIILYIILTFILSVLSFSETYKVFLIVPMTGEDSNIGTDIKDGLNAFLKYIESVNGFSSYEIIFKIIDNGSFDLKDSFVSYLLKNSNEPLILTGGIYDKEVNYLVDFCEKEKIPYIFPIKINFKNQINKYFFPVIPSYYSGLVFLKNYFKQNNMSFKVIYDEQTKENAFMIFEPETLVDYNSQNINLNENTLLYLSSIDRIISFLEKFNGKTTFFFNHSDIVILDNTEKKELFNNSFFISWIKTDSDPAVSFFIEEFEKIYNRKPNTYNLIGWSIGDIVYEVIKRSYEKNGVNRDNIVSELEKFSESDGYESTLFKIHYSEFAGYISRIGVSGFYFLNFIDNQFKKTSDFYRFYEILNKVRTSEKDDKA